MMCLEVNRSIVKSVLLFEIFYIVSIILGVVIILSICYTFIQKHRIQINNFNGAIKYHPHIQIHSSPKVFSRSLN